MKMYDFGITLNGFYVHDPDILEAVPLPEGLDPKVLAQLIIERSGSLYPFIQADTYLKRQIHNWFQTNYHNFERILLAINADYSPIENYDRTEERSINRLTQDNEQGSSNHSSELTGRDTITGSTTGSTESETTESGSNTASATNTAATSSTTTGENITLRAADNSETFRNVSKETSSASSSANDTATNSSSNTSSNTTSNSSSNSVSENSESNKTQNISDVDSMTRAGTGSEDVTETLHAHGNIGTTRNSEMVLDEIELRKYNIYEDIAARFEDKFMIAVY